MSCSPAAFVISAERIRPSGWEGYHEVVRGPGAVGVPPAKAIGVASGPQLVLSRQHLLSFAHRPAFAALGREQEKSECSGCDRVPQTGLVARGPGARGREQDSVAQQTLSGISFP